MFDDQHMFSFVITLPHVLQSIVKPKGGGHFQNVGLYMPKIMVQGY
jgi:hypothetical protein